MPKMDTATKKETPTKGETHATNSNCFSYSEHAKKYTIIGWWREWNISNRCPDMINFQLSGISDDVDRSGSLTYSEEFVTGVKQIITEFALICFESGVPRKQIATEAEIDKNDDIFKEGKIRIIMKKIAEAYGEVMYDKWIAKERTAQRTHYNLPTMSHNGALMLLNFIQQHVFMKYVSVATWHKDRRIKALFQNVNKLVEQNEHVCPAHKSGEQHISYFRHDIAILIYRKINTRNCCTLSKGAPCTSSQGRRRPPVLPIDEKTGKSEFSLLCIVRSS